MEAAVPAETPSAAPETAVSDKAAVQPEKIRIAQAAPAEATAAIDPIEAPLKPTEPAPSIEAFAPQEPPAPKPAVRAIEAVKPPEAVIIPVPSVDVPLEVPAFRPPAAEVVPKQAVSEEAPINIPLETGLKIESAEPPAAVSEPAPIAESLIYERPALDLIQPEEAETQPAEPTKSLPETEVAPPPAEESFVARLPETVQARLEIYQETAPPEEVIIIQSLEAFIELAIIELEELQALEAADPEKIIEAEERMAELYDELLQRIGVDDPMERRELIKQFVAGIRLELAEVPEPLEADELIDEKAGTHENKRSLSITDWTQNFTQATHQLIGGFIIRAAWL